LALACRANWHGTVLGLLPATVYLKFTRMKLIYTLAALLITFSAAHAKTLIKFKAISGDWSDGSNWDLNRVPQDGDSIVIPQGHTVFFDKVNNMNNVFIMNAGVLTLEKKMRVDGASIVQIAATGSITAGTNNRVTETIEINGVEKYDQNAAAAIFGPSFASNSTGISPNGFSVGSILPVVYTSFYATRNNSNVVLNWSTADETNNKNFEVQRSLDGNTWTTIAVMMGAGTTSLTQMYSFTDKNMTSAVAYYRIRQADADGKSTYSIIKTIRLNAATPVTKIYAANKIVSVEFNQEIKNPVTIRLVNMNGQVIAQQSVKKAAYRITMNANSLSGIYVVQVSDGQSVKESAKVML
jgi:G8 domain